MSDPATFRRRLASAALAELEELDGEWAATVALLDRHTAFAVAVHVISQRVGVEVGFAAQRTDDMDTLQILAIYGNRSDAFSNLVVPSGMGLAGKVAVLRRPISVVEYLNDTSITHDFDPCWREEGLCSALAVPIVRGHLFYGVLCAASRERRDFTDESIKTMVQIARYTALAIDVADNAQEMIDVAVHEERQRMALTLHDSVGAMLFSIGAAVRDLGSQEHCSPTLRSRLTYVEQQVAKTTAQLRHALAVLHEVPREMSLGVTLQSECRVFEQRSGIPARCVVFDGLPAIGEDRARVLLLTAREALLNAEKHSQARCVVVTLHAEDEGVNLVVADDGVGVPTTVLGSDGLGLGAAVERVEQAGGRLVFANNEEGGFILKAWVPC